MDFLCTSGRASPLQYTRTNETDTCLKDDGKLTFAIICTRSSQTIRLRVTTNLYIYIFFF